MIVNNLCYYCYAVTGISIDQKDNNKGYTVEEVNASHVSPGAMPPRATILQQKCWRGSVELSTSMVLVNKRPVCKQCAS
jgi:hypothetical protein